MGIKFIAVVIAVLALGWFARAYTNVEDQTGREMRAALTDQCMEYVASRGFCECFADRRYRRNIAAEVAESRFYLAVRSATFGAIELPDNVATRLEEAARDLSAGDLLDLGLGCALSP